MAIKTVQSHLTRGNYSKYSNPQCFSRETIIGNHWELLHLLSFLPNRTPKQTPSEEIQ